MVRSSFFSLRLNACRRQTLEHVIWDAMQSNTIQVIGGSQGKVGIWAHSYCKLRFIF